MHDKISEEQLELEAFKAVAGGDYVRQRLLHGLSMGTPSIDDDTYLIKSRVKRVDSLISKVIDRRAGDNPNYRPYDARDIVGLRLLTLFKNDLPVLVRRFMTFVEWSQKPPFSLFYGMNLCDVVEEIKIYATSDVNDVNTNFIVEEFKVLGFTTVIHGGFNAVEVLRKESQYSSVHIVLWANGPTQHDKIPIEVQLRTSLEDAWGEIDHRLRYKARITKAEAHRVGITPPSSIDDTIAPQLSILKKNLDSSSDLADLLGAKLKSNYVSTNMIRPYTKLISFDLDRLIRLERRTDIKAKMRQTVDDLSATYRAIYNQTSNFDAAALKGLLDALTHATKDLITLLPKRPTKPSGSSKEEGLGYWLFMEVALCWYWRALILQALISMEHKSGYIVEMHDAIKQALKNYRDAGSLSKNENNALLQFRIANVISLRGEHELARSKYRAAYEALPLDKSLAPNHNLRLRVPRSYALALWDAAERSKMKALEFGSETLFEDERRNEYLSALDITLPLYRLSTHISDLDRSSETDEEEDRTTVNNIIEYALSYLSAGGYPQKLADRGVSSERLTQYVDELVGDSVESITRLSLADTVREAARWLGNRKLAVRAAKRVLALIPVKDFAVLLPEFTIVETEANARRELDVGEEPFAGFPIFW